MESELDNNFSFDLPKNKSNVIKVIGVGGGGSNAINYMFQQGIKGVDFVISNTDAQALNESAVPIKIQLGASLTEGLGAGANPEVGALAAEESLDDIKTLLNTQTKMVFITAGMGGGTGTGAAPIIAKMAKEMDILTVGIVTMPFQFEGKLRLEQAEKGLEKFKKTVDALIVINNNKLREVYGNLGFKAGFSKADEVLATAARGIAEVITHHYRQNIDLKDAKTVLKDSGTAIMGSGSASGTNRAQDAIINALDSPLLNDNKITGCKNVLLLIVSGTEEITIDEIGEINDFIQTEAGNNANIIMGIGEDPELGSSISVTIIATGFGIDQQHHIVNTEAKKIIHTLEEDQTLEHELTEADPTPSNEVTYTSTEEEYEAPLPQVSNEEKDAFVPPIEEVYTNENVVADEVVPLLSEEELFSIDVVAETVVTDEQTPQSMGEELDYSSDEIKEMDVIYELLQMAPLTEESPIPNEEEEEFIINDLGSDILDLDVVDSEAIVSEEENQFTFDFGLPISEKEESPSEKIIHSLSEEKTDEHIQEDAAIKEALDFKFEVVEKREENSPLESEDILIDSTPDTPFDKTISEANVEENEKRKEHLKKFNHAFKHSMNKIDEFEKQPAYKRMGVDIEESDSPASDDSRMSVENDNNDEIQLRSNNSFLHDNVD
ncbi:MAG: Cell division protein FtsZ [Flavobacteriaceae bacterium]|nr:MAG: Cell division protein FtsZ [Flavobacteriaceae bacterium]